MGLFFNAAGECVSPHIRLRGGCTPPPQKDADTATCVQDFSCWEVYVEPAQIAPALKDYSSRHDLMVSKKLVDIKRLGMPLLLQGDADDGEEPKPVTVDTLARRVQESVTARQQYHKVST